MLLYNIPQFSNGIPLECARQLLGSGKFAGIKDSSGDPAYLEALLAFKAEHDFILMIGNDRLLVDGIRAGANGVVSGVACALPEVVTRLYAALKSANQESTAHWQHKLNEFLKWIDCFPTPTGIKVATALRGLKVGPSSIPSGAGECRGLQRV